MKRYYSDQSFVRRTIGNGKEKERPTGCRGRAQKGTARARIARTRKKEKKTIERGKKKGR